MSMDFELFGHYAGSNLLVNGHQFVKGKYVFAGNPELIGNVVRSLSYYKGYLVGSLEWEQAKAWEQAKKEEDNGKRDFEKDTRDRQTDDLQRDVQSGGAGSTQEETGDGERSTDSKKGEEGAEDQGGGSDDPRDVAEPERKEVDVKLVGVIRALDPDNDDHWTVVGLPSLSAIEEAYSPDVTRGDIEQAFPGYNREQAAEDDSTEDDEED